MGLGLPRGCNDNRVEWMKSWGGLSQRFEEASRGVRVNPQVFEEDRCVGYDYNSTRLIQASIHCARFFSSINSGANELEPSGRVRLQGIKVFAFASRSGPITFVDWSRIPIRRGSVVLRPIDVALLGVLHP